MSPTRVLAGITGVLIAIIASIHVVRAQIDDEAAVRVAVETYFHGIIAYDEAALRGVFHPNANVTGVNENGELNWAAFDEWVAYTLGTAPDPTGRVNRILSIDITGPAAVVKTELDWPAMRYTDYLSLLKIDGEWKITNKIWSRERPASVH